MAESVDQRAQRTPDATGTHPNRVVSGDAQSAQGTAATQEQVNDAYRMGTIDQASDEG